MQRVSHIWQGARRAGEDRPGTAARAAAVGSVLLTGCPCRFAR